MEGGDSDWESERMLRLFIYAYLKKTGNEDVAEAFWKEALSSNLPTRPQDDVPGGFLHELGLRFFKTFEQELPKNADNEGSSSSMTRPGNPSSWSKQEMFEKLAAELTVGGDSDDAPGAFLNELWSKFFKMFQIELQKTPESKGSSSLVQERINLTQLRMVEKMTAELTAGGDSEACARRGFLHEMWLKFFQKFGAQHAKNPDKGSSSVVHEMIKLSQPGNPSQDSNSKQVMNEKLTTELTPGHPVQPDLETQSK
ncbi:uncharacterized protein LOC127806482 isoform X2 [Diospyros lotus]|uniref:uncharacterized protein LOC127806482 isoform X2 n=1 Tax=Diospyros lotus TaxID=55363 RepID=UPI0022540A7B|nr:uncharacterized protein LOC127806482 isoform X2 [Diospyros lotus]